MSVFFWAGMTHVKAHMENEISYVFEDKGLTIYCTPQAVFQLLVNELNVEEEQITVVNDFHDQLVDYFNNTIVLEIAGKNIIFGEITSNFNGHDGYVLLKYENLKDLTAPVNLSIVSFLKTFRRPKNYVWWKIGGEDLQNVLDAKQTEVVILKKENESSNFDWYATIWLVSGMIAAFVLLYWLVRGKNS